jgi:hypothetical protein
MQTEDSKEIEKKLSEEIFLCQLTLQYIEALYHPDNKYKIESANGFFDRLQVILADYLILKLIRLFERKKDVFSLKYIQKKLPHLKFSFPSHDEEPIKSLLKYRHDMLAHLNSKKKREDFPSHEDLIKDIKKLINILHDVHQKIRAANGKNSTLRKEIVDLRYSSFDQLISYGAFLEANSKDKSFRSIIHESVLWHQNKRDAVSRPENDK